MSDDDRSHVDQVAELIRTRHALHDLLSHQARADLAYRVLTGMQTAGVTVLRGPDSQPWTPVGVTNA